MFYLVCNSLEARTKLIDFLKRNQIHAVFHYLSLYKSPFYKDKTNTGELVNSDMFADRLVRLPFFYDLDYSKQKHIIDHIVEFYEA